MSAVSQTYGPQLFRYKGLLWLKGHENQMIFQGVHMLMGATRAEPGSLKSLVKVGSVFIGRDLPRDTIEKGLQQCLV